MNDDFDKFELNPFENVIVRAPNEVSFSVAGFNERPLDELIAKFEKLTQGRLPRSLIEAPVAQLVLSPDAGYGKSHLLGRLFDRLGERATLIYVRPFQAAPKAWHSILLTTVQALKRGIRTDQQIRSQLDAFALGVLAHLAADYLADQSVENKALATALDYVRENPLKVLAPFQTNNVLIDWLRSALNNRNLAVKLASLLNDREIDLRGREKAWLKVLGAFAFAENQSLERDAALKWIRGEPLEDEELSCLKLDAADNEGKGDSSSQEINELCFRRLRELCTLSAYFRPVVFCFDQTENYAIEKELIGAFGQCIQSLVDEVPNHLTIVAVNLTNWDVDFLPNLAPAYRARFSPGSVLNGIDLGQARELISRRMKESGLPESAIAKFLNGKWLDSKFSAGKIGVRALLNTAAQHFSLLAHQPEIEKLPLGDLFARHVNEIRAKEALQQYNQDCLMWFAQELIKNYNGVTIKKLNKRYFSTSWDWLDRSVFFAFEEGDHHRRWESIAKEAVSLSERAGKYVTSIVFRTPDLKKIPKSTWTVVNQQIGAAKAKGFRIVELDLDEVCELHAAREFYSNALEGNVGYAAHEVMNWLKEHFVNWFEKYSTPILPDATDSATDVSHPSTNTASISASLHDLDEAQLRILIETVRQFRLVDIKQVLQKLGSVSFQPALLRAVEQSPNLKAHPCPQTIYLQWRHVA